MSNCSDDPEQSDDTPATPPTKPAPRRYTPPKHYIPATVRVPIPHNAVRVPLPPTPSPSPPTHLRFPSQFEGNAMYADTTPTKVTPPTSIGFQIPQLPLDRRGSLEYRRGSSESIDLSPDVIEDKVLTILLKTRESAERKDLDYLIGAIAREMVRIKHASGLMPKYRCSGTKLCNRSIQMKCKDQGSLDFYRELINKLPGYFLTHGGYFARGPGDPPQFKRYRAWIPGEMIDSVDYIPDFLSIETDGVLNSKNTKIVSHCPSSSNGHMVYFEVDDRAEEYIKTYASGIMCSTHKLKFAFVHENLNKTAKPIRLPKCPASPSTNNYNQTSHCDNWRSPTPSPVQLKQLTPVTEGSAKLGQDVDPLSIGGYNFRPQSYKPGGCTPNASPIEA